MIAVLLFRKVTLMSLSSYVVTSQGVPSIAETEVFLSATPPSPIIMASGARLALKNFMSLFFQASQNFFSVAMIARWLCARLIAGLGEGDGDGDVVAVVCAWAKDAKTSVRTMTRGSRVVMVVTPVGDVEAD